VAHEENVSNMHQLSIDLLLTEEYLEITYINSNIISN